MATRSDVVIVGAGAVGLTTALELARSGASVTVLERGEPGQESSWAGAGILPPGHPDRVTEPMDRLRAESSAAFPSFVKQLRELTGIDPGYRRCGAFYYDDPSEPIPLNEWQAEGIAHERCNAQEVERREPSVTGRAGYFVPEVAQVRNPRLVKALVAACEKMGVSIVTNAEVTDWEIDGTRIEGARTAQDLYAAGEFLVCGGSWTAKLLARFSCRVDIRPIRGQIVLYRIEEPGPQFIHHAGDEYLVPRGDGFVLIGSTQEDVGFDKRNTDSAIQSLRQFAESFCPCLGRGQVEKTWAGLRPGNPDGRPFLGRVPGVSNLSVGAGHFRWGIAGAPATARMLTELLTGRKPFIPLDSFSPGRPTGSPRSGPATVPVESAP